MSDKPNISRKEQPEQFPESINFDFVKSNDFRVIHADGCFLGTTQTGVAISFYSERQPIPRRLVHKVNKDGGVG